MKNNIKTNFSYNILLSGICLYIFLVCWMQNPYQPILNDIYGISISKIQISDIILLCVLPFGIYEIIFNWKKIICSKIIILLLAVLLYLISLLLGIDNYMKIEDYFDFFAACSLSLLFFFILYLSMENKSLKYMLFSGLASYFVVVCISLISLIIFYLFDFQWLYILQKNPVFPYLGEISRLTGPFKPTAKLLSTFLTLWVPLVIILSTLVSNIRLKIILKSLAFIGIIILPFTLSRSISGFCFVIFIVCLTLYLNNKGNKIYLIISGMAWLGALTLVWFFSTFHITSSNFNKSYDFNPSQDHTVYYYFDPIKGQGKIDFEIKYAFDHYYWLKKASSEIFRNNYNGIGNKSFSKEVLKLEEKTIVPKDLSRHPTPQSELHRSATFYGWFGLLSVFGMFFSWMYTLWEGKKNQILFVAMGSIFAVIFIDSWFMEILRFRFLWVYIGIFIGWSVWKKNMIIRY